MEPSQGDGAPEAVSSSQANPSAEPVKRMKRPVKPDKEKHQAQISELQEQLNIRRTRSEQLRLVIEQKKQSGGSPEVVQARNQLNGLLAKFRSEVEKKQELRNQNQSLNGHRDSIRNQMKEQRSKLGPYVTVQKIDERLRHLEYMLTHTTIALKEEMKARDEIKKTAALKPLAAAYAENQEKLKASETQRDNIMSQIKKLDDNINGIKTQEEKAKASLNELKQKDAAKVQDVPALIKERDECREVMNALYEKMQQLRAEFKEANNVYYEENQRWKQEQQQIKAERDAQREKEWQAKQAERKAIALEFGGDHYHEEVGCCDQLLSHLSKHMPQTQASEPSTTAKEGTAASIKGGSAPFEGMKAVTKGSKIDDEFGAFLGSNAKKGKGKKGKQQGASQAQAPQKLNHSFDILNAFARLKVAVPTTTDKVPETVKEVEASKAYWLAKRKEADETGVVPEKASSSVANGITKTPKAPKNVAPASFSLDEDFPDIEGHLNPAKKGEEVAEAGEEAEAGEQVNGAADSVKLSLQTAGEGVKVVFA